MRKAEARALVHSAVFRIVRQPQPLPISEFFDKKIEATIPDVSPSGWKGFWYESVAVEIQTAVMSRRQYVLDFGFDWLTSNKGKKWEALITHMGKKLIPIP